MKIKRIKYNSWWKRSNEKKTLRHGRCNKGLDTKTFCKHYKDNIS